MSDVETRKSVWVIRKKPVLIVGAIVVIVFLGALAPLSIQLLHEMRIAHAQFTTFGDALVAKDYERAWSLTSPEFQDAITKADFIQQQKQLCLNLGALKAIFSKASEAEENENGVRSTIDARFVFEKGERQFQFVMKKNGTTWLVLGYEEL